MKTNRYIGTQIVIVFFLFAFFSNVVWAETTECTIITSLPYTISTQGIYCLKENLVTDITSGSAITINSNNVVINLNGYRLGGLPAGPSTDAIGIYANEQENITIRNGTVRGFFIGIWLSDRPPYTTSHGYLIEDIYAEMNAYIGIDVHGRGNTIRNNQVVNTGGSTATKYAHGIISFGPGAYVLNNDVVETKGQSTASAYGVYLNSGSGAVVENNRIWNSSLGTGASHGIYILSSSDVLVSNNRVITMNSGVYYDTATGGYSDNLTIGVTDPYTGGTDAGGNK